MDTLIHIGRSIEILITETGIILIGGITAGIIMGGLIEDSEMKFRREPRGSIN
jgi:hypothetical protein